MAKRAVLFHVGNIRNGGDELLLRTTEWLLRRAAPNCETRAAQLLPNRADLRNGGHRWGKRVSDAIARVAAPFSGTPRHLLDDVFYRIRCGGYFRDALADADAAVFAVGMLKFATQDHSHVFDIINGICTGRGIPVLMSAMSVAAADPRDWRSRQLLRAVNAPCVRMVTTRDGAPGLERLRKDWIRRDGVETDFVGDPALWAPECYGVRKDPAARTFGIGLIRGDIFRDYRGGADEERLLGAYCGLVSELDRRGIPWTLFSNGAPCDQAFGKKIIETTGAPAARLLPAPEDARRLLEYVASFRAVFAGRLHACISAFALDVPAAGLDWDDKLDFVTRSFGIDRFFSGPDGLDGDALAKKLEEAADTPQSAERRNVLKEKTMASVARFAESIFSGRA